MSSGACTTVAELQRTTALKLGLSPADCRLVLPHEGWRVLFHIVQGILQRGACTPFRGSLDIPGVEVQSVGTDHLGRDSPLRCATLCVPQTPNSPGTGLIFTFCAQVHAQVFDDADVLLGTHSRRRPEAPRSSPAGELSCGLPPRAGSRGEVALTNSQRNLSSSTVIAGS